MAHIHIAATPGVTIEGFRAVAAKHNPPQDIDGLLAWAAGTDSSGLHVVTAWPPVSPRLLRRAARPRRGLLLLHLYYSSRDARGPLPSGKGLDLRKLVAGAGFEPATSGL